MVFFCTTSTLETKKKQRPLFLKFWNLLWWFSLKKISSKTLITILLCTNHNFQFGCLDIIIVHLITRMLALWYMVILIRPRLHLVSLWNSFLWIEWSTFRHGSTLIFFIVPWKYFFEYILTFINRSAWNNLLNDLPWPKQWSHIELFGDLATFLVLRSIHG